MAAVPIERDPQGELTAQTRAGLVAWHLANGEQLRTLDVARLCRLSVRGARDLLYALSLKLPIYQDAASGCWQRCEFRELNL
jgi:hypothetical protein